MLDNNGSHFTIISILYVFLLKISFTYRCIVGRSISWWLFFCALRSFACICIGQFNGNLSSYFGIIFDQGHICESEASLCWQFGQKKKTKSLKLTGSKALSLSYFSDSRQQERCRLFPAYSFLFGFFQGVSNGIIDEVLYIRIKWWMKIQKKATAHNAFEWQLTVQCEFFWYRNSNQNARSEAKRIRNSNRVGCLCGTCKIIRCYVTAASCVKCRKISICTLIACHTNALCFQIFQRSWNVQNRFDTTRYNGYRCIA